MRGRILLLFIVVPLIEAYLFIKIGSMIGALATIGLVILTAVIGSTLVRAQGLLTLQKIRQAMEQRRVPALELIDGGVLLMAGLLLITPGFLTDSIGFLCMIPPLRHLIARYLLARWARGRGGGPPGSSGGADPRSPRGGHTIEGEYQRDD